MRIVAPQQISPASVKLCDSPETGPGNDGKESEVTTTFEKFAGTRCGNYCTLPKVDVEILPDHHVCDVCNTLVMYVPQSNYGPGQWVHVVDSPVDEPHLVTPRTRCRYCNSHDAKFRQHAWHDAVECNRCGGVDGYAIGD